MNRTIYYLVGLLLLPALAGATPLQGGDYRVYPDTLDGGGGRATGGDFVVTGSIGQPEAGPSASGDAFLLRGGFWRGELEPPPNGLILIDGFED